MLLSLSAVFVAVAAEVMIEPLSRVVVIMVVMTSWLVADVPEVGSEEVVVGSVVAGMLDDVDVDVSGALVVVSPLVVGAEVLDSTVALVVDDELGSRAVDDEP